MNKPPQKRLGRGLASLISTDYSHPIVGLQESPETRSAPQLQHPQHSRFLTVQIASVRTNPMQPRRNFDDARIKHLAESLKRQGALQPIVVRPAETGYELVAGERRLRAAVQAGLTEIPAIIRAVRDDQMLELALVENLQRADLNPVERARAYRQMNEKYGLSHEQIAERVGDDRATVANYIRLLALPGEILEMLEAGLLTMGHARAILGSEDKKTQLSVAASASRQGWSVRRVESEIARLKSARAATPGRPAPRPAVAEMQERIADALGTRVLIIEGRRRHTGRIILHYAGLEDFERLAARLGVPVEHP